MKIYDELQIMELIGEPLRYIEINKLNINLFPIQFSCLGNVEKLNNEGIVTIKFWFGNAINKGFILNFHPLINYHEESGFKLSIDKIIAVEDLVNNSLININNSLKSVLVVERNRNEELILNISNGNTILISAASTNDDHTQPEVIIKIKKTKEISDENELTILKEYYCKIT